MKAEDNSVAMGTAGGAGRLRGSAAGLCGRRVPRRERRRLRGRCGWVSPRRTSRPKARFGWKALPRKKPSEGVSRG